MLVLSFLVRSWLNADPVLIRIGYNRRHVEFIMFPPPALASRYRYWKLLGEGGFGQVYKATRIVDEKVSKSNLIVLHIVPLTRHDTCDLHGSVYCPQTFAIKLLSIRSDPAERQRFLEEGMLLEKLQHPNIVGVEERSDPSEAQHPYIVMEYCSGGDLRGLIDGLSTSRYVIAELGDRTNANFAFRRLLEEGQIMGMFVQVLLALHFCHTSLPGRAQVLHRDLKPENSM